MKSHDLDELLSVFQLYRTPATALSRERWPWCRWVTIPYGMNELSASPFEKLSDITPWLKSVIVNLVRQEEMHDAFVQACDLESADDAELLMEWILFGRSSSDGGQLGRRMAQRLDAQSCSVTLPRNWKRFASSFLVRWRREALPYSEVERRMQVIQGMQRKALQKALPVTLLNNAQKRL